MKTITFSKAEGKFLDYGNYKVRCDEQRQLDNWIKYVVVDGEVYFDSQFDTFRVVSERQEKANELHANCMQNWINTGGSLD